MGVTTGWLIGIGLDVLNGTVIGQHALAMSVIACFTFIIHLRLRLFPVWQQCLTIFLLIGVYNVILYLVQGMVGTVTVTNWMPCIVSALLWPWVMVLLRYWRRQVHVT